MNGHPTRRSQAGFTLLEVMAALSIFLIGIVSVLALLTTGTRLHQESQSTALAADATAEIVLLVGREIDQGDATEAPDKPVPGRPELRYRWRLTGVPEPRLWRLVIDVSWLEGGKTRTQTIEKVLPSLRSPRAEAERMVRER